MPSVALVTSNHLVTNCQIDFAYNYWPHKTIISPFADVIAVFLLQQITGFQMNEQDSVHIQNPNKLSFQYESLPWISVQSIQT